MQRHPNMFRFPAHLLSKPFQVLYLVSGTLALSLFLPASVHPFPSWRAFFLESTPTAVRVPEKTDVQNTIQKAEKKLSSGMGTERTEEKNSKPHPCAGGKSSLLYGHLTVPCVSETAHALNHFIQKVHETKSRGERVRIAYFTDSIGSGDKITSTLRDRFQARFGNGGPGYVPVYPLRAWHYHAQVHLLLSDGWKPRCFIGHPTADRHYGFGGIGAASQGSGNTMRLRVKNKATSFSSAQIHFLRHPEGGVFRVSAGGKTVRDVNTRGERHQEDFVRVSFDETSELTLETRSEGLVRINAVFLEKSGAGVVLDAVSLTGARFENWYSLPDAHLRAEMAARAPDLVLFHFGLNESDTDVEVDYPDRIADLIRRIHQAIPASCVIVGPTDKVQKFNGQWRTLPVIRKIAKLQRQAAEQAGCAFFDTLSAMGGETAILRWYDHNPRLAMGDLTHITSEGGELLGDMIYGDLLQVLADR